jgi:hypothetical protein
MGKAEEFYNRHLEYLQRGDIDGLLRDQYHDDAEMVTFDATLQGKEAIKRHVMEVESARTGTVYGAERAFFAASDDCVLLTEKIHSEKLGTHIARVVFYFRDGKVYRHVALTLPPDKDPKPVPLGAD